METNPVLGLLGLSRRAGKLACGEEQVGEMVAVSYTHLDVYKRQTWNGISI